MKPGGGIGKRRRLYAGAWLLLAGMQARAQVFTASGGVSTITNAQGAELTMTGSAYAVSVGGGESNGQFVEGFRYVRQTARAKYIAGNQLVRLDLGTDVFDPGHFVDVLGLGIETSTNSAKTLAFAGATSTDMSNPLFTAFRADHIAAGYFREQRLGPTLKMTSYNLITSKLTSIQGLQWKPTEHLALAVSGGVGADHDYGASSLDLSTAHLDLKAAYIYADSEFQRAIGRSPALAEPDRGNVAITWMPSTRLTFTGAHQNFLSAPSSNTPGLQTSLDDLGIEATFFNSELSATAFHSTYSGALTNAFSCSITRGFGQRLTVQESYLEAAPSVGPHTTTILTNITEKLTPRWELSELITQSGGQNTVSFGGSFLSNIATISVDYQNYYVPSRIQDPFEEALIADVQLHAFGRVTLHGATFVDPQGHLKYTADAVCVLDRQSRGDAGAQKIMIGDNVIRGRVIDSDGQGVAGAALRFDDTLIYTDSTGRFFLRERRARPHKLQVMTGQFLDAGRFSLVDAPKSLTSGNPDRDETVIVIRRED
jgi:hypothetical protein